MRRLDGLLAEQELSFFSTKVEHQVSNQAGRSKEESIFVVFLVDILAKRINTHTENKP